MPVYEFISNDGQRLEKHYPINHPVASGDRKIRVGGKHYRRVVSKPKATVYQPTVSQTFPRNLPFCHCDRDGKAIISGPREAREVAKRLGYVDKG